MSPTLRGSINDEQASFRARSSQIRSDEQDEAAYAQELEARKNAQELLWYAFEGVTLKLADGCRYTLISPFSRA